MQKEEVWVQWERRRLLTPLRTVHKGLFAVIRCSAGKSVCILRIMLFVEFGARLLDFLCSTLWVAMGHPCETR